MNHGYMTGVQLWLCIIVLRPSQINSLSNQVMLNLIVIHQLLPSLLHSAEQQLFLLIRKRRKCLYRHQLRIQSKQGTYWWQICSQQPLTFTYLRLQRRWIKRMAHVGGLDWDRLLESSCSRFAIKYLNLKCQHLGLLNHLKIETFPDKPQPREASSDDLGQM